MLIQPNDSKRRSLTFLLQLDFFNKMLNNVVQICFKNKKMSNAVTQGTDLRSTLYLKIILSSIVFSSKSKKIWRKIKQTKNRQESCKLRLGDMMTDWYLFLEIKSARSYKSKDLIFIIFWYKHIFSRTNLLRTLELNKT